MFKRDLEDDDYRDWHEAGRHYGWFDRARDGVRRLFGMEDYEPGYEGRTRQDEVYGRTSNRGIGPDYRMNEADYIPNPPIPDHEPGLPYAPQGYRHQINERQESGRSGFQGDSGVNAGDHWRREVSDNRMYGQRYGRQTYGQWGPVERWTNDTTYGDRGTRDDRSHAGRGPRNYQRSDERIREDVIERLTHDPRIDATDVEIVVNAGVVTLTGMVDDRQQKRLALDIVEDVFGVNNVQNRLQARRGM